MLHTGVKALRCRCLFTVISTAVLSRYLQGIWIDGEYYLKIKWGGRVSHTKLNYNLAV